MSAPQFTPGPWRHREGGSYCGDTGRFEILSCGDGGWVIASTIGDVKALYPNEEANGRLIAAAPDYDAAADQAIAAIEALTGTIPEEQMDALMAAYASLRRARFKAGCDVRPTERAALAKARGDQ